MLPQKQNNIPLRCHQKGTSLLQRDSGYCVLACFLYILVYYAVPLIFLSSVRTRTILTAIRYQFRLREKPFTFPSSCGSDMRNRLYSSHIANHIIRKVFYRPPFFHYSKGLLSLPDSKISPVCSSTEMISFVSENSTSRTCCTLGSFSSSANAPIISIDK